MKGWVTLLAATLVLAGCSHSPAVTTEPAAQSPAVSDSLSGPTPKPTTFPGKVAYIWQGKLWLQVSGEEPQQLTEEPATLPVWSPDGRALAYATRPTGLGVWQSDSPLQEWHFGKTPDGPPTSVVEQLQWSPNSRHLAMVLRQDGASFPREVWLLSEPGGLKRVNLANLQLNAPFNQLDITWRPDSKGLTVATVDEQSMVSRLVDVPLDGSEPTLLLAETLPAHEAGAFRLPTWSPDGKRIAFLHAHPSGSISADGVRLRLYDPGAKEAVELGSMLQHGDWLSWSPDSKQLAYVQGSGREAGAEKRVMIWSGEERQANVEGESVLDPVWLPDSAALWTSHQSGTGAPRRIWKVSATGERLARCPEGEGNPARQDYSPIPTPDGGLLFISVIEKEAVLFYANKSCQGITATVVEQFDLPDPSYGHYPWEQVISWHP